MKLAHIALGSIVLLGILAVGCKKDEGDDNETLGTVEAQLVDDDSEASETDDDLEAGLDEPLSGSTSEDPGNPADGSSDEEVLEKVRTNPGKFFRPAGCIQSTREGNKLRHVFEKCRGPWDLAELSGTIVSTYAREPGKLTVTHTAEGFTANGAAISGTRTVVYTREGSIVTKTRTGSWSGKTAKGRDITHEASFVTTYDVATKCLTRDGTASTTIGGRSFERVVDGFARCGIGRGGCPTGGKITLTRTKSNDTATLSVEFVGGTAFKVTRPSGREVTRNLVCRAG